MRTGAKFNRLNKRRQELIRKKYSVGLNAREEKIFDRIQNYTMEAIEENMPGMRIDFRPLIRTEYELKQIRRRLYPKGEINRANKVVFNGD